MSFSYFFFRTSLGQVKYTNTIKYVLIAPWRIRLVKKLTNTVVGMRCIKVRNMFYNVWNALERIPSSKIDRWFESSLQSQPKFRQKFLWHNFQPLLFRP